MTIEDTLRLLKCSRWFDDTGTKEQAVGSSTWRFMGTTSKVGRIKFIPGKTYRVVSSWYDPVRGWMWVKFSNGLFSADVPYSSREAFEENWEHVASRWNKCDGCSMLYGSMGQSSPCAYCRKGDLNSSRFRTDDEFWDAYERKIGR